MAELDQLGIRRLPYFVRPSIIRIADSIPLLWLLLMGVAAYIIIIFSCTWIDLELIEKGHNVVQQEESYITEFWDLF